MIFLKSGKVFIKIFRIERSMHIYMGGFVCTWSIEKGQYAEPLITPIYNFNDFAFWFLNFIIIIIFFLMITSHSQMRKKKTIERVGSHRFGNFLLVKYLFLYRKNTCKKVKWVGSCKQSTTYVNIYLSQNSE